MICIEVLPDKATNKTVRDMIEQDKYNWREQGLTQSEVKDRMVNKLFGAYVATGEERYYHLFRLLKMFRANERVR